MKKNHADFSIVAPYSRERVRKEQNSAGKSTQMILQILERSFAVVLESGFINGQILFFENAKHYHNNKCYRAFHKHTDSFLFFSVVNNICRESYRA